MYLSAIVVAIRLGVFLFLFLFLLHYQGDLSTVKVLNQTNPTIINNIAY